MQGIDRQLIETLVKKVIDENIKKCHVCTKDTDVGVKSIRAGRVEPEPFDTGKQGDKVWLKDLFTIEESPRLGAGIMEMDQTVFDWTLNYDEIDYVIEGTLEIIVAGKKIVGHAGDVLLIPKGSDIQFSSPGFCRFLYVVYPANWADQK